MKMKSKYLTKTYIALAIVVMLLAAMPLAALADVAEVYDDFASTNPQNHIDLNASPGAAINTSAQIVIQWAGNKHVPVGTVVAFASAGSPHTNLPGSYSVAPVTLTIPSNWGGSGGPTVVSGTSAISFTAPATSGTYSYKVRWTITNAGPPELTGVPDFTINLTVASPPPSDTTAPTTTAGVSPSPNGAGWNNTDVTITLAATDNAGGSGVKQITYAAAGAQTIASTTVAGSSTDVSITTEGETTVTFWAEDNDGNVEAAKTVTVRIDKTAPDISGSRSPEANSFGWNNVDVTVTFTATDALSGLASVTGPVTFSSEGADQSVTGTATDLAGNSSSATVSGINIDKTKPAVSGAPATAPNANGWYKDDVTVQWTTSDALSGIDPSTAPADSVISTEGADQTAGPVTVADKAGNISDPASVTGINIDKTAPAITIVQPANTVYYLNQAVAADFTVTDALSGIDSMSSTVPNGSNVDTGSVGTKTFTVAATDKAGNETTVNRTYTVAYDVKLLYDHKKPFKSGSTIPVKLQVCDAGGDNYSSSSVVVHATGIAKVSATVDGVLQDSGNANPDYDFRFDSSLGDTGGYIYNLSTKGFGTGTYKMSFTVTGDPTTHYVLFELR